MLGDRPKGQTALEEENGAEKDPEADQGDHDHGLGGASAGGGLEITSREMGGRLAVLPGSPRSATVCRVSFRSTGPDQGAGVSAGGLERGGLLGQPYQPRASGRPGSAAVTGSPTLRNA